MEAAQHLTFVPSTVPRVSVCWHRPCRRRSHTVATPRSNTIQSKYDISQWHRQAWGTGARAPWSMRMHANFADLTPDGFYFWMTLSPRTSELVRKYAIKWSFVVIPLLTNVSALPGETWTPEIVPFQSRCIPCLENDTALASISSTLIISVSATHLHPQLDEEQLSAAQFWDSNGHISDEENVGRQWQHAFRSDVALLRIVPRIDVIVLQVDWRRYSEHLFVREEDNVDSMFRQLLKRQPQCRFQNTNFSANFYELHNAVNERNKHGAIFNMQPDGPPSYAYSWLTTYHIVTQWWLFSCYQPLYLFTSLRILRVTRIHVAVILMYR